MPRAIVRAQVINLPVGIPVGTSGAGNARTDADNFFIRNNVAGMTDIPFRNQNGQQGLSAEGQWRFNGSLQLSTFLDRRERFLPGPTQGITTETRFGPPLNPAGEFTYTRGDRKFAFGLGAYTIFGFQSKLKDPPALGPLATFFDTRVASNDFAVGVAMKLHPKLSVGASFILGRGFVDLARPNPTLALLRIPGQDRLDVARIGAPGASVGLFYRPMARLSFGINYKTKRNYNLDGSLETFDLVPGPSGAAQVIPVKTSVTLKLKPPAIAEGGFEVKGTDKLRLFADFRFYDYTATFQQLVVRAEESGQPIVTLKLDAFDVRSFRTGGLYALNPATILQFGWAYTSKGLPDAAFSPGTINTGGFDFTAGVIRRIMGDRWLNIGVAGVLAQERKIGPPANPLFPGKYGGWGGMLGVGIRW
ncbi:MAG TPA: outer membrane protein transport protein [Blastocatellia bacterium]|jgi:long-subunit fatty acid transport protein|nr:outer membrane protein transport protein [Blastocatellia bacterium]